MGKNNKALKHEDLEKLLLTVEYPEMLNFLN